MSFKLLKTGYVFISDHEEVLKLYSTQISTLLHENENYKNDSMLKTEYIKKVLNEIKEQNKQMEQFKKEIEDLKQEFNSKIEKKNRLNENCGLILENQDLQKENKDNKETIKNLQKENKDNKETIENLNKETQKLKKEFDHVKIEHDNLKEGLNQMKIKLKKRNEILINFNKFHVNNGTELTTFMKSWIEEQFENGVMIYPLLELKKIINHYIITDENGGDKSFMRMINDKIRTTYLGHKFEAGQVVYLDFTITKYNQIEINYIIN